MEKNKKDACLTGQCPPLQEEGGSNVVKLSEGSGGEEMHRLICEVQKRIGGAAKWKNTGDDGATYTFDRKKLVFTSDSYVVTPIFFKGGNIGTLAYCGTINDLSVMGADPLGLSLSLVLEEGFEKQKLFEVMDTIGKLSKEYGVPVVTGDTKVIEKGKVDQIIINTSGVGRANKLLDERITEGDVIIVSGGIGEHGAALLARRFDIESSLATDSKPVWEEIKSVRDYIRQAKDITRGGLAAVLNELADKNKVQLLIEDEKVPLIEEVRALTEILGIDHYSLACEGRFVCVVPEKRAEKVLSLLKKFNKFASIIGRAQKGSGVIVQTLFGKKILPMPSGIIVPRIC